MPSPQTKSGQRKLSEVARHLCQPDGIVSTGWPAVRDRLAQFRIPFDVWQQGAGRLILAKRSDGMYAAGVGGVVISIPRQVGKTYMIGWIVFALCTLTPGMTVIWTAHHTRTSTETFGKMQAMAGKANVAPYIETIRATNGEQAVIFTNGSRILFGARAQGFGLGFDQVDVLVLDEAQRVTEVAMNDMVPATNAAPNGLVLMMGTPPRPTDNGEVFTNRRQDALDGDPDTLYIEFSADEGAKIIDWDQVAKANPSFPHRTGKTAILRMQKLLGSDEGFYREGYGIWDAAVHKRAITAQQWDEAGVDTKPVGINSFGVAFSQAGDRFSIAGATKHDDGVHVELLDAAQGGVTQGLGAVADWLAKRWPSTAQITIAGSAHAGVLMRLLLDRKVPARRIVVASTAQYLQACAMTVEAVRAATMTHLAADGQEQLDDSVSVVALDKRGGFVASTPDGDETPLEAVAVALWGARTSKRVPRDPNKKREAVIL